LEKKQKEEPQKKSSQCTELLSPAVLLREGVQQNDSLREKIAIGKEKESSKRVEGDSKGDRILTENGILDNWTVLITRRRSEATSLYGYFWGPPS